MPLPFIRKIIPQFLENEKRLIITIIKVDLTNLTTNL